MGIRSQNNPLAAYLDVFSRSGTDAVIEPGLESGLTATGGIISEYASGPTVYRAHVFTSSGTFEVDALSTTPDIPNTIEYLVVAGGGGGGAVQASPGYAGAGGGGAGGVKIGGPNVATYPNVANVIPVSVASYAVTIGAGGMGGSLSNSNAAATNGSNSVFGYPSAITATGGGAGSDNTSGPTASQGGSSGGSGGGSDGRKDPGPGGAASPNSNPDRQGYPGGSNSGNTGGAGGGGGAMGAGNSKSPQHVGGPGGIGVQSSITGTATYYAGGGGGGSYTDPGPFSTPTGGSGGGGAGGPYSGDRAGGDGEAGTGGGGGGGTGGSPITSRGGNGGSGILVVRYQIASVATAKATGGVISFYGGKTIHTFISSGTFTAPGTFSETVEYVVVGGGGSGGSGSANTNSGGGGGGAGTYRTGSVSVANGTYNITIGAGGGKNNGSNNGSQGSITTLALPSSVASPGGGYGYPGPTPGYNGGSSGGTVTQSTTATGSPFPGTIGITPPSGWGHIGNNAPSVPAYNGGGGGGAGGAAPPQTGANLSPGGLGIQIPSTFRNPTSTVGAPGPTSPGVTGADNSGKFYVAGGGGGAAGHPQPAQPKGGDGGAGGGGDGGGIDANGNSYTGNGSDALQNTGSGGGGGPTGDSTFAGGGGSGLVLIAYPT